MPVFKNHQQLVKLGAIHPELLPRHFIADVTRVAIVSDLECFERNFLRLDFIVTAALREPWILRSILLDERFEMRNREPRHILQMFAGFIQLSLYLLHLFAMFVDIEKRYAANANFE